MVKLPGRHVVWELLAAPLLLQVDWLNPWDATDYPPNRLKVPSENIWVEVGMRSGYVVDTGSELQSRAVEAVPCRLDRRPPKASAEARSRRCIVSQVSEGTENTNSEHKL